LGPSTWYIDADADGLGDNSSDTVVLCAQPDGYADNDSDPYPGCTSNYLDECNECDGNNSTCTDCAGTPNGEAIIDDCGICTGGETGLIANYLKDCSGVCGGNVVEDCFGICNGDRFLDCDDNCRSASLLDDLGDGNCDTGIPVFDCAEYNCDNGDCGTWIDDESICSGTLYGCTDSRAENFNEYATIFDNSCVYEGRLDIEIDFESDDGLEISISSLPSYTQLLSNIVAYSLKFSALESVHPYNVPEQIDSSSIQVPQSPLSQLYSAQSKTGMPVSQLPSPKSSSKEALLQLSSQSRKRSPLQIPKQSSTTLPPHTPEQSLR
jgi:hypothetical protein